MLVILWTVLYVHVVHSQNTDYMYDPDDPNFLLYPNDPPGRRGHPPKAEYFPDKEFQSETRRLNREDSGESISVISDEDNDLSNRIITPDIPIRRSNPDEPNRSDDVDQYYGNDENIATNRVSPTRKNYKIVVKEKLRFHKPKSVNRITRTRIRNTRPLLSKTYRTKLYKRGRRPEKIDTYNIYTNGNTGTGAINLSVDSGSGSSEDTIIREKYLQDSDSDNFYTKKSKFKYQPNYYQQNLGNKNKKVLLNHKYFDKQKYPKILHHKIGNSWVDGYSATIKDKTKGINFGDYDITDKTKYIPYRFGYKKPEIIPMLVKQELSYPSYSSRLQNEGDAKINIYNHSPKSLYYEELIKLDPYEDNVLKEKELFKSLSYQDRLRFDDTSAKLETLPKYVGTHYQYQGINNVEQNYVPQLITESSHESNMYKKGSTTIFPYEDGLRDSEKSTNDKSTEKLETVPDYEVTHNQYQNMQKFKDGDSQSTRSQEQETHEIEHVWEVTSNYKYKLPKKTLNAEAHDFPYPTLSTDDQKSYDYLSVQRLSSTNKLPNTYKYEDFPYLDDYTKSPLHDFKDNSVTPLDSDIQYIDLNTSNKELTTKKPEDLSSEFFKADVKEGMLGESSSSTDDYSNVEYGDSTAETPTNFEDLYTTNYNASLRDWSIGLKNNSKEYNDITEETPRNEDDVNTNISNVPLNSNDKNNLSNEYIYKGVLENTIDDGNLSVMPLEGHDLGHYEEKFTYSNTDDLLPNEDVKVKPLMDTEASNNTIKESISSKPYDLRTALGPTGVIKQTPFSSKHLYDYYLNTLMNESPPDDPYDPWELPTFQNNGVTDNPPIGTNLDSDEDKTRFEEIVDTSNNTDAFVADGENVEDIKQYLRDKYAIEQPVVHFLQQNDITNKTNSTIKQPSDNEAYLNQPDMENNLITDKNDSTVVGKFMSSGFEPPRTNPNNSLEGENVSYIKYKNNNPSEFSKFDDDKYWTSYYIDNSYSGSEEDTFETVEEQKDNTLYVHGEKIIDEKSPNRMPIHHSASLNPDENTDELGELCALAKNNLKHLRALVAYTYGLNTDTADENVLITIVYIMGKLDEARLTKRPVEKLIDDFLVNIKRLAVLRKLLCQDFDQDYDSRYELLSLLKKHSKTTGENPMSYYERYHQFDSTGLNDKKKEGVVRRPDQYPKFAPVNIDQYQWQINPSHQDVRETYDEKLASPTPMDVHSVLFGMHKYEKQYPTTKVPLTTSYINQMRQEPLLSIYGTESTLDGTANREHKTLKLSDLNIEQREHAVKRPDGYPKFAPGNNGLYQWQINPSYYEVRQPDDETLASPTPMDVHSVLFGMQKNAKQAPATKVLYNSTYINQIREKPLFSSIYDTESTSGLNIEQNEGVVRRPDHYPNYGPGNIGQYQWLINPTHQDMRETYNEKLASTPMDMHSLLLEMHEYAKRPPNTKAPLTSTNINQITEQPLPSSIYDTESRFAEEANRERKKFKLSGLNVEHNEEVGRPDHYSKYWPGNIGQYQWQINPSYQEVREIYDEKGTSAPMNEQSVYFEIHKNAEQAPTTKVPHTSTFINRIKEQPVLSSIYGTESTSGLNIEQNEGVVRPDHYPNYVPGNIGQYQWKINPIHQDMRDTYDQKLASTPKDMQSVLLGMHEDAKHPPNTKVPITSTYINQITEQPLLSSIYGTESILAVDANRDHKKLKFPKRILHHKTNQYITKEFGYPNYVDNNVNNDIHDTDYYVNNDLTSIPNSDTDSMQLNTDKNFVLNLPFEGRPTEATQVDWNKKINNADYTSKDNWPIPSDSMATLSPFGEGSEYLKPHGTDSASSSDYEELIDGLKKFENSFIYNKDIKYPLASNASYSINPGEYKHLDGILNENKPNLGAGPVENENHQEIIMKGAINKVDLENIVKEIHYKSVKHGLREGSLRALLEIQDNINEAIITEYLWNQIQLLRTMNIGEEFINRYVYMVALNRLPNLFMDMHICELNVSSKLRAYAKLSRIQLYKKIFPNVNMAYF